MTFAFLIERMAEPLGFAESSFVPHPRTDKPPSRKRPKYVVTDDKAIDRGIVSSNR